VQAAEGSASDQDDEGEGKGGAKAHDHEPSAPTVLRPVCGVLLEGRQLNYWCGMPRASAGCRTGVGRASEAGLVWPQAAIARRAGAQRRGYSH
jgi:hypothetical protein